MAVEEVYAQDVGVIESAGVTTSVKGGSELYPRVFFDASNVRHVHGATIRSAALAVAFHKPPAYR